MGQVSKSAYGAEIGTAVRHAREAFGIAQGWVAKQVGISQQMMCDAEYGRRILSPELRRRILALLGASPEIRAKVMRCHECGHALEEK